MEADQSNANLSASDGSLMNNNDVFIYGTSFVVFALISWILGYYFLFSHYKSDNRFIQFLFVMIVTCACLMYETIIFQIVGICDMTFRYYLMKLDLLVLSSMLGVVIPLYLIYLILYKKLLPAVLIYLVLFFFYIYRNLRQKSILTSSAASASFASDAEASNNIAANLAGAVDELENSLNFVGIVGIYGVTLMAFLSGFGSVTCPYNWLKYFATKVDDIEQSVQLLTQRIHQTLERQIYIKRKLSLLKSRLKLESGGRNGRNSKQRKEMVQKVKDFEWQYSGLCSMHNDLYYNLLQYCEWQHKIELSNSLKGKLYNFLGHFMALYCVYKIVISVFNVVFERYNQDRLDPIAKTFHRLNFFFGFGKYHGDSTGNAGNTQNINDVSGEANIDEQSIMGLYNDFDIDFWSQQISFAFVGIIVASQIRGILVRIIRIVKNIRIYKLSSLFTYVLCQLCGMLTVLPRIFIFIRNITTKRRDAKKSPRSKDTKSANAMGEESNEVSINPNNSILNNIISDYVILLFLIELMGFYFISSILLLRMQLPIQHRQYLTDIIGANLQFYTYHKWFDEIYVATALSTILFLAIHNAYKRFYYRLKAKTGKQID